MTTTFQLQHIDYMLKTLATYSKSPFSIVYDDGGYQACAKDLCYCGSVNTLWSEWKDTPTEAIVSLYNLFVKARNQEIISANKDYAPEKGIEELNLLLTSEELKNAEKDVSTPTENKYLSLEDFYALPSELANDISKYIPKWLFIWNTNEVKSIDLEWLKPLCLYLVKTDKPIDSFDFDERLSAIKHIAKKLPEHTTIARIKHILGIERI